jgi:hypothetical protein
MLGPFQTEPDVPCRSRPERPTSENAGRLMVTDPRPFAKRKTLLRLAHLPGPGNFTCEALEGLSQLFCWG